MCDQTDARTICGRSLTATQTLLTRLTSAQPPRRRAPYKSILCPRTLAAAVAFAATHRLHPDNIAVRFADSQPGSLLPCLLSHMNLLGPIYSLDAAFWDDMCRLVGSALTDAMRVLAERGVLTHHWHQHQQQQEQGNGQRQGAQQDHDPGPHWTWCEVTLARWRRMNVHHNDADEDEDEDEDEDHILVEEMDQMLYATTSARERARLNEDELTARIAQIRAQLPPIQVLAAAAAAGQRQTPRQAELVAELHALLQLDNAARANRNRNSSNNNCHNNDNNNPNFPKISMHSLSHTTEGNDERQQREVGGADQREGRPTVAEDIAAAKKRRQDIATQHFYRHQERSAVWLERMTLAAQLDGKETELARLRAAIMPNL